MRNAKDLWDRGLINGDMIADVIKKIVFNF